MLERGVASLGITTNHTFGGTGITAYLENSGTRELDHFGPPLGICGNEL